MCMNWFGVRCLGRLLSFLLLLALCCAAVDPCAFYTSLLSRLPSGLIGIGCSAGTSPLIGSNWSDWLITVNAAVLFG